MVDREGALDVAVEHPLYGELKGFCAFLRDYKDVERFLYNLGEAQGSHYRY